MDDASREELRRWTRLGECSVKPQHTRLDKSGRAGSPSMHSRARGKTTRGYRTLIGFQRNRLPGARCVSHAKMRGYVEEHLAKEQRAALRRVSNRQVNVEVGVNVELGLADGG